MFAICSSYYPAYPAGYPNYQQPNWQQQHAYQTLPQAKPAVQATQPPPPPPPQTQNSYTSYPMHTPSPPTVPNTTDANPSASSANNGGIRFKFKQPVREKSSPPSFAQSNNSAAAPAAVNGSTTSARATSFVNNCNSSQGVGSSDKLATSKSVFPKDWPPELHDYVNRAFNMSTNEIDKDRIEIILRGKLTQALNQKVLLTKDWKNEPLPVLSKIGEPAKPSPTKVPVKSEQSASNNTNNYKFKGYFSSSDKSSSVSSSPEINSDRYYGKRWKADDDDKKDVKKKKR